MIEKQESLFEEQDLTKDWEKEWQDMPEYKQDRKQAYANINVRFRNEEDLQKFAKIVDQNLNQKTQAIWYPKLEIQNLKSKRYVDES
jgi:DNA repair ATPase RecN